MSGVSEFADRLSALRWAELPPVAIRSARRCLVDVLGCAIAGLDHPATVATRRWAIDQNIRGDSAVWFTRRSTSAKLAAFANAAAASILDLDDGHRAAAGHPGAAVVPAALAEAERLGSDVEELLLAIVCGYEAGVGLARRRRLDISTSVASGRWTSVGVAAAVAKLRGLEAGAFANALSIAETHSPNLLAADHAGFRDSDVKEGIPWSVYTGCAAVDLAETGFRGYRTAFDNGSVYRAETGLAQGPLLIESTYFKPYACCRWIHSALDAVLSFGDRLPPAEDVDSIDVFTFRRAASLKVDAVPRDLIDAQFNIPFAVAGVYVLGAGALQPMVPEILSDGRVARLAACVRVVVDEELDRLFPSEVPARVRVSAGSRTFERQVSTPKGDPANPMSDRQLIDKAIRLAASAPAAVDLRPVIDAVFADGMAHKRSVRDLIANLPKATFVGIPNEPEPWRTTP